MVSVGSLPTIHEATTKEKEQNLKPAPVESNMEALRGKFASLSTSTKLSTKPQNLKPAPKSAPVAIGKTDPNERNISQTSQVLQVKQKEEQEKKQ